MTDRDRDLTNQHPAPSEEEQTEPSLPEREAGPGEYVGRARPIDPDRRRSRPDEDEDEEDDAGPAATASLDVPEVVRQVPSRGGRPETPSRPGARPARRLRQPSARGAVDRVRAADFPVVLRGYDRAAVDAYVAEVAQLVAELEATQLPETVVQRALEDVGEETSGILKRAHEAAEEMASRSRSQAEGRLQRAEREAEITRREAEEYARRLEQDSAAIWQERGRLLEEIRQLADDVLAIADDASERIDPPTGLGDRVESSEDDDEPTTVTGPDDPEPLEAEDEQDGSEGSESAPSGAGADDPPTDEQRLPGAASERRAGEA